MKVFLKGYFKQNLGDDLFVSILLNRYNEKFYTYTKNDFANIFTDKLKIYNKKIYKLINVVLKVITLKRFGIEEFFERKSDISVLLGGSMFIEKKNERPIFSLSKPYYIIGSNFGPYLTNRYYKKFHSVFDNAEDVCFREKYSKDLFTDLNNIRYAADIVFTLDTSKVNITNNKKVVISVIDCGRKLSAEINEKYENKMIDLIKFLIDKGYNVCLMSYCKAEKDEIAIESILSKIKSKSILKKISTYYYNGNITEALNIMGDCQIVVGARFHANIIGMILGKTVIPLAYSDKTLNVFNDMKFNGKIFDLRNIDEFDISKISEEDLNFKFDITFQKEDAKRQFEVLDKILNRKEKNE